MQFADGQKRREYMKQLVKDKPYSKGGIRSKNPNISKLQEPLPQPRQIGKPC